MGIELRRAGIKDFLILEKADDVGGTWRANTYPGVAVDVPGLAYSFSYSMPRQMTRLFPPGQEVKAYADQLVDEYDLRPHLRFKQTVTGLTWDDDRHLWQVDTKNGSSLRARFVVLALGGLEIPKMPKIAGLDTFPGKLLHTAEWDHDYCYENKRIAVIGTGATAVQIVPELQKVASRLMVFQRTPIWVGPKMDARIGPGMRWLLRRVPGFWRALRVLWILYSDIPLSTGAVRYRHLGFIVSAYQQLAVQWHRRQLKGHPDLFERLTPKYTYGYKRPSVSNTYLRTFTEDNVELITDPIAKIDGSRLITADGTSYEADVLVCATGFHVLEKGYTPPFPVHGREGVELGDFWDKNRFQAYQGVSVPRFPNLFLTIGPYAFAGGNQMSMIECTTAHARRAITEARRRGATAVEVTPEAHAKYFDLCVRRMAKSLWLNAKRSATKAYYIDYHGDVAGLRPTSFLSMWWGNKHFPHRHYRYSVNQHARQDPPAVEAV